MLKRKNKREMVRSNEREKVEELGRKRIDPEELVKSICINLKQKILTEIEKEGNPKHVIEKIITEKFSK